VQLIEPDGMPDVVRITWPPQPAVVQPAPRFPEVAATLTRLFAEAATTLAALKARGDGSSRLAPFCVCKAQSCAVIRKPERNSRQPPLIALDCGGSTQRKGSRTMNAISDTQQPAQLKGTWRVLQALANTGGDSEAYAQTLLWMVGRVLAQLPDSLHGPSLSRHSQY
jgi:hypothetical protein